MGRPGPEAREIAKMRKAIRAEPVKYRAVVIIKYHGSEFSEAGVSDLLCCVNGAFVAIEVKAPTGKHPVSPKQEAFGARIANANGTFAVVRTVEEFLAVIDQVLWEQNAMT